MVVLATYAVSLKFNFRPGNLWIHHTPVRAAINLISHSVLVLQLARAYGLRHVCGLAL